MTVTTLRPKLDDELNNFELLIRHKTRILITL